MNSSSRHDFLKNTILLTCHSAMGNLTQSDVNQIRRDFYDTLPTATRITAYSNKTAKKYGVSTKTIRDVLQHRTWIPDGGINTNSIEEKSVRASIRLMLLTDPFSIRLPPSSVADEWSYADVCTHQPGIDQIQYIYYHEDGIIDDSISPDENNTSPTLDNTEEEHTYHHIIL